MRRSLLTLVAVCTGWGTIPLVARHVDLSPAVIVFARVWIATGALSLVVLARARRRQSRPASTVTTAAPRTRGFGLRIAAAGALLAVHWTAMFAGYQAAPADTVVFVVFLAPVGIALLAPRTLGERLTVRTVGALALALAGFALVAGPALEPGTATGLAWAGLSAITFVGLVLVSKPLAEEVGGLRLNLLEMAVAGVLLVPVAAASDWTGLATGWPWLVVLGVHTGLGITLYLAALARVPATHVGILGFLEPVAVVVLAWLVLGDAPAVTTVVGGALVVAAGVLVVVAAPRALTPPPVPGPPSPSPRPSATVPPTTRSIPPTTTPEVPARVPG